jgi:hypothetical protein
MSPFVLGLLILCALVGIAFVVLFWSIVLLSKQDAKVVQDLIVWLFKKI